MAEQQMENMGPAAADWVLGVVCSQSLSKYNSVRQASPTTEAVIGGKSVHIQPCADSSDLLSAVLSLARVSKCYEILNKTNEEG